MKLAIIVKGICVTTSSIDAGVVVSKVSLLFSMLPPSSYRLSSVAPAELMILSLIGSWLLDLIKNTNIHTTSEYSQLGSTHACIHKDQQEFSILGILVRISVIY